MTSGAVSAEMLMRRRPVTLESYPEFITAKDPFRSFDTSTIGSSRSSRGSQSRTAKGAPGSYFRSRRIRKGVTDRPELEEKDPMGKWVLLIPLLGVVVGLIAIGLLVWDGLRNVVNHKYCHVFTDDFSNGFNSTIWTKECEVGGYGLAHSPLLLYREADRSCRNGEFEQTTGDDTNIFVRDGKLVIKPTLQNATLVNTDSVVNLTADGTCSSDVPSDCVISTNTTSGYIVNPVKSGRINTMNFAVIKYGRVEITAKLAAGDWLLSTMMMLPALNSYGAWPASGETDIAIARGNNYTYQDGGDNVIQSSLRWGPNTENDGWFRTNIKNTALHTTFADNFNTFGLEWSEKYLFTYLNSRLMQVLYVKFNVPFFERGFFPPSEGNGTMLVDPWAGPGSSDATPFDQPFYLILDVAVGGTTGWFADGMGGKPWADASPTASKDFWDAKDQWYPTWEKGGAGEMVISKVEMWQQCD